MGDDVTLNVSTHGSLLLQSNRRSGDESHVFAPSSSEGAQGSSSNMPVSSDMSARGGGSLAGGGGLGGVSLETEVEGKWEWMCDRTTFMCERAPQGLQIPEGFTVRKSFEANEEVDGSGEEYVQVRFLQAYDMAALGQCEGEGGVSVAQNVLRFLRMDSPTSVDVSPKLRVPLEVKLRANALRRYMTNDRDAGKVQMGFRSRLHQEGWVLSSFNYDVLTECLNMEWTVQS